MKNIIDKIQFLTNVKEIERITDSLSGADVFRVLENDTNYLLKIMNGDSEYLNKIRNIVNIYTKYDSDAMKIINSGIINDEKIYCIYSWIDGYALNKKYGEISCEEFYNYGLEIGKKFVMINQLEPRQDKYINNYDINSLTEQSIEKFSKIYYQEEKFSMIISENYLTKLINLFRKLTNFFDKNIEYIHGDMQPKNVMINEKGSIKIIDCESFCLDYFVMNFRWCLSSAFMKKENKAFIKGVIDGRYDKEVPINFFNQLLYILILKFFEQTVKYYENKDLEFILDYVTKYKQVFDSVTLSTENIDFLK